MSKNKGVKNMIIDCLSFGGQEFRAQLTQLDGSCSGSLMRFESGCQLELQPSTGWMELEGLLPGRLTHMAVSMRPQLFPNNLAKELCKCLDNMATGFPWACDTERKAEATKSLVT